MSAAAAAPRGPLAGIRILDLSRVLAGPFCSMILADLGAEVVKIEEIGNGDQTREIPPFVNGESHYFLAINRNKRSVALDLKHPDGRAIALDLARRSDVVLENFRPGVMERLGLDPEALRAANPSIVICSISGFGQTGSMRGTAAFDLVTQAMSGAMSINGEPDGPPTKIGIPLGDIGGGAWAAIGVLSALLHRARSGEGLHVDLSLLQGLIGLLGYLAEYQLVTGRSPGRVGSGHHIIVPYGRYEVRDGHLVLAVHSGDFFVKFCSAIGRPELATDAKFSTATAREANRDELQAIVRAVLLTRTASEWHEIFRRDDIPHSAVLSVGEALEQPLLAERGFLRTVDHPTAGPVRLVGSPLRFADRFEEAGYLPPPLLGEHTRDVLAELGYDPARIERLVADGVVACAPQQDASTG